MVATCGGFVPMISGRGLGHTGGTLDKLDSIPGYISTPDPERLRRTLQTAGCAIIGQTSELAPADRRLYAIRDVTATVESVALITASILSKKLAAGLQGLLMDVKVGNGAFAATPEFARELAQSLVTVAQGANLPTRALITDMNQMLGDTCGNALEVQEAVDFLTGKRREPRLLTLTQALCAELLLIGGLAASPEQALEKVNTALDSGAALEQFSLHGLRGTSTQEIADRAGISKQQLHYYIESKDALYESLLRRTMQHWRQIGLNAEDGQLEPIDCTLESLLGHRPRSLATYVRESAELWTPHRRVA